MKAVALGAVLLSMSAATMAAEVVGQLRDVQGSVTVSSASGVVKAVAGTPLAAGSRILLGTGAKATVQLTEGCVIPLKANQYLALNPNLVCTQLVASVTQLAEPRLYAGFGDGKVLGALPPGPGGSLIPAAVIAGMIILNQSVTNDLSGN